MNILNKTMLLAAVSAGVFTTSCKKGCIDSEATNYDSEMKKDDGSCTYAPVISLNGSESVTVGVGETYTDEGATATNSDGTTVSVTDDATAVNTNVAGVYVITYTASNEYGTAETTRTVNVVIKRSTWLGDWDVDCPDCGTTSFPVANTTGVSGAGTNGVDFDGFFTLVGGTAISTVDGADITFPNQTINVTGGDIVFSGTGTMNAEGTVFTVNYTWDNQVPIIGGQGSGTATYTRP